MTFVVGDVRLGQVSIQVKSIIWMQKDVIHREGARVESRVKEILFRDVGSSGVGGGGG